MSLTSLIAAILLGYILGSIPFGVILTRAAGAGDLHSIGSGGTGATNVLRTGRKGLAAATLLLDLMKGVAVVALARAFWPGLEAIAGLAAVVGHCYPIWLRFRGGKGVATLMGVALGLSWQVGLAFALVWIGVLAITRISSAGGMSAAIAAPIVAQLLGYQLYAPALAAMALVVLWRHRDNIRRLLTGKEPRIGQKG
ncbi:glycerol-3-phosphate 1-O-acyltransferase PlsY [Croceicoccus naphthovorans]|uniref:Glycerol-3-phosphate acyltransferase n=1 Tax=Croceicoccus naphthovorans TaxID=1348774 RepID=A0A0G3XGU8_9SPHN|nr:glycerol-3-phosphate 1-O-acyltransferase PlsY [Croceicoccus naphthovorans]AKM10427.1 glycerol-3-phosphate acyltransferase [Croceicoccus naphthovorans]MBB3990136.1 glycerol-3-phosphate acyltransferase PlsY [Croceicoccus naphthovorans]